MKIFLSSMLLLTLTLNAQLSFVSELPLEETGTQQVGMMKFHDALNGYALLAGVANGAWFFKLMRTNDGGLTWTATSMPSTYFPDTIDFAADANHIFLASQNSTVTYRSVDGGQTLIEMPLLNSGIGKFCFRDALRGFHYSTDYLCYCTQYTNDGGITWSQVNIFGPSIEYMYFPSPTLPVGYAFFPWGDGKLETNDDGLTWTQTGFATTNSNASGTQFTSSQIGYRVKAESVYKTIDAGMSWQSISDIGGYKLQFTSDDIGYMMRSTENNTNWNSLYQTTDGGYHWYSIPGLAPFVNDQVIDISFPEATVGYVVMSRGDLYKFDFILNSKQYSNQPSGIFPNPSNEELSVINAGNGPFKIYDLTGRKVLESQTGTKINVSNLSKGIYILRADGFISYKFEKK